ncbi:peroxiredoxin Q/BCP [Candidatus Kinetoplastibacterium blastocrithidii TCC012E]|uniref:thioredoxin-dependent peroxiredoxin n=1 Tax=Candidatus Kinetoplastidibacterium blastocrithidiae TCC012E TaxID=1208922 RepID=M1LW93_9PROT|nr:peroxiredoxin [Candidatus Kinetoplastibacterium blastocrithidii]AFZ83675.1 peroxiredoxin Q/BCP [Candidatus Kinetoplastibacterium blastocrithidii (ex Strigomonas culicis)]AGF49797.1 peroxiredoxin Q/BCP [Candidatus Kinetoplastibacterium blastocrithidii TCC012E]
MDYIKKMAPIFEAMSTNDIVKLEDYRNKKNIVLFFYPRDNTSGCTKENIDFQNYYQNFLNKDTLIFGISRDSIKSHNNFSNKLKLTFPLISDKDGIICNLYNVLKEKKMYGKIFMGIDRSTFIINKNGFIIKEWRSVKVNNHVHDVFNFMDDINLR